MTLPVINPSRCSDEAFLFLFCQKETHSEFWHCVSKCPMLKNTKKRACDAHMHQSKQNERVTLICINLSKTSVWRSYVATGYNYPYCVFIKSMVQSRQFMNFINQHTKKVIGLALQWLFTYIIYLAHRLHITYIIFSPDYISGWYLYIINKIT